MIHEVIHNAAMEGDNHPVGAEAMGAGVPPILEGSALEVPAPVSDARERIPTVVVPLPLPQLKRRLQVFFCDDQMHSLGRVKLHEVTQCQGDEVLMLESARGVVAFLEGRKALRESGE